MSTSALVISCLCFAIWLAGWISSYCETSASQQSSLLCKVWCLFVLFFIWPFVAWAMMRSRHLMM